jgi:hypothetical protein
MIKPKSIRRERHAADTGERGMQVGFFLENQEERNL